jgi:hypothetical protein
MPEGVKHPRLDLSLLRAVPLIAFLNGGVREPEGACVLFLEAGMVYMLSLGRRRPEPLQRLNTRHGVSNMSRLSLSVAVQTVTSRPR